MGCTLHGKGAAGVSRAGAGKSRVGHCRDVAVQGQGIVGHRPETSSALQTCSSPEAQLRWR